MDYKDRTNFELVVLCLTIVIIFSGYLAYIGWITIGFIFLINGWFYVFLSYQNHLIKRDIIKKITELKKWEYSVKKQKK